MLDRYLNPREVILDLAPDEPVWCLHPETVTAKAREVVSDFAGDVLYAVKCNHDENFLRAIYRGGVHHFDTASLGEIAQIKSLFPDAQAYFMHPVKSPEAIAAAAARFGVRHFVLDHPDELRKILGNTQGLNPIIVVRIAMARGATSYDLGGKFGCELEDAAELLRLARAAGQKTGISFHVGSQCMTPEPYVAAFERVEKLMAMAPGPLSLLDVGGGFPARYVGDNPPPFADYAKTIAANIRTLKPGPDCRIACEPGRTLVADGASLITRIELRRGNVLHINDGVFGSLSEMRYLYFRLPMTIIKPDGTILKSDPAHADSFLLSGPTCDPADSLPGPYKLPAETESGDYLVFGTAGAYTLPYRTRFNGFYAGKMVQVESLGLDERREGHIRPRLVTAA